MQEGEVTALSATEAKRMLERLKTETKTAKTEAARLSVGGLFKEACSTDLLLLMDTTGSMRKYIDKAKDQVRSIVKDIKEAFLSEADLRLAVVGYKDHGDRHSIQFLEFTHSADKVCSFLDKLEATGGADVAEDVLGGILQALNASWKHQSRCIIHIADAPPHGSALNDLDRLNDSYHVPGSEPHRLTHEPLLQRMMGLSINYVLLRINSSTDKMAITLPRGLRGCLRRMHPAQV